jgi:hypothetical protein
VSARDPLQAALAKIAALEAALAERPADEALGEPRRVELEQSALENEIDLLRERHAAQLAAMKTQHQAQLDAATVSTRAQIEHARMQSELQSVQLQAELVEYDRETYVGRLNALAVELSAEIDVLLSFSREEAAKFYSARVADEAAVLTRAEEAHATALRSLARKEAEAQASGQRTITQMAEIDMALNVSRAETHAAGVAVRDAKARLEALKKKLARSRG